MTSILLDDDRWQVETGGAWRTLWSLFTRDLEYSNCLVTDKASGERWRLLHQEQEFLNGIAERVVAMQLSPEFQHKPKIERRRLSQIVNGDCLEAIAMKRRGDNSKMESLAGMNQPELTSYIFGLWKI